MTQFRLLPTISIVTPSLNQGEYLGEALQSVQSQSYRAMEHIVLDGGSKDLTQSLLSGLAASDPVTPLLWRSHSDEGQSAALNEGFTQARGEIIGWLNADDRYRPECFSSVVDAFAKNPEVDVLYGDYTFVDRSGQHLKTRREIPFSRFILKYHHVLTIPTCASFFRRRIFDEGYRLQNGLHLAMDLDFYLRLSDARYHFEHLPSILADFRIHPEAKSSRFTKRQMAEHQSLILQTAPLNRIRSMPLRVFAARSLQIPAALLRCSQKVLRTLGQSPLVVEQAFTKAECEPRKSL